MNLIYRPLLVDNTLLRIIINNLIKIKKRLILNAKKNIKIKNRL